MDNLLKQLVNYYILSGATIESENNGKAKISIFFGIEFIKWNNLRSMTSLFIFNEKPIDAILCELYELIQLIAIWSNWKII